LQQPQFLSYSRNPKTITASIETERS